MTYVVSILITAILFVLLILLLSVKPSISKKITFASLALAGVSGFFIYGYGYAVITDNILLASLNALRAVCSSFVGRNDFDSISSVPIMQTTGMQIFFAFVNICALYATASAIITTIGREALKKLRLLLVRRGNINVIYGINDDTLDFGRELVQRKQGIVVYVSESSSLSEEISDMGAVLKTDVHALKADKSFLRSIGFTRGHRTLTLYALDKNSTSNICYSKALLETCSRCNTTAEKLRLVVLGKEEAAISQLQNTRSQFGYGFVSAVDEAQLVARLLVLKYPPCDTVAFDCDGKATEDFHALVIGFGQVGQAVLKKIVMNGQFEGSNFHLDVVAANCTDTCGRFSDQLSSLSENYDISFYEFDARSRKMYEYLAENRHKLKYVAVAAGNENINHEIAEDLIDYFNRYNCTVPVFKCSRNAVETYAEDGMVAESHSVYRSELLCGEHFDKMAMVINSRYQSSTSKTPVQQWMECDYFSRQSCRASADFVPAMIRASGKTAKQVAEGDWNLTDAQKDNLSKTEHLRWCAFHYCMGFSVMTDHEFDLRAKLYLEQLASNGSSDLRISKNMFSRTHACLIGWDELKALSEKEEAITGEYRDYQKMDTDNVMAVPKLMQIAEKLK